MSLRSQYSLREEFRTAPIKGPVTQDWVHAISFMQQTVLLTAIRGPDGVGKYHPSKYVLRWYRRCVLLSAMDGRVLETPDEPGGGSFTGQSFSPAAPEHRHRTWQLSMHDCVTEYLKTLDEVPHHFQMHFMHGAEIVGYKHPDPLIREWWRFTYERLVHDLHLYPETEAQLDQRLGDTVDGWLARADEATRA